MKIWPLYLVLATLLLSCNNDDPEPGGYSQDWILDLGDYLKTTYPINGNGFQAILVDNGNILVNEYNDSERHLVEVDWKEGMFVTHQKIQNGRILGFRKRVDGKILVVNYASQTRLISTGFYDASNHQVQYFSVIDQDVINPPNSSLISPVTDDFFYTFNANISPESSEEVYLAKWNFDGSPVWTKIIDPTGVKKIASIQTMFNDHIIGRRVSNSARGDEQWSLTKFSSDGEVIWDKPVTDDGSVFYGGENSAGNFFITSKKRLIKLDANGSKVWENPLADYQRGFSFQYGIATNDGGFICNLQATSDIMFVKVNSAGQIVWELKYWEKNEDTGGLSFYELPTGDLIVTTSSGFITKYKLNK